jgi:HK97 family phage portal protein
MNLFSKILTAFGVGGLANTETGAQYSGPASRGTETGITVSDERAMQVSAVWSCARLITETVGSLPLGLYERKGDSREPLPRDHYLYQLLRVSPNQYMNPQEFREAMTLQLVLWGNAYGLIDRIGNRPVSVIPLKPEHMTVVRDETGLTYHYATTTGVVVYTARSIFHLKGFSVDGIVGLSPLAYARQVMGVTVAADKYASKSFANGGRPTGVITVSEFLNKEQREKVQDIYEGVVESVEDNLARVRVLEGGMKYEPISIPPDDMQMLQSRQFQLGEIARIFRIPSHLINDSEKATAWGSGIEQLNIGFLQYTLRPYLTRWEGTIDSSLVQVKDRSSVVVEHNVEGLLRADSAARSEFYSKMAQNGLMTRNEIRKKENLPSMVGGDDLTVQVNLTPVQDLEKDNAQQN